MSKALPESMFDHKPQTEIVIERREVVATIPLSPNGTVNPIGVAFQKAGEYLGEEAHGNNPISVSFEFGEAVWTASYTPNEGAKETTPLPNW